MLQASSKGTADALHAILSVKLATEQVLGRVSLVKVHLHSKILEIIKDSVRLFADQVKVSAWLPKAASLATPHARPALTPVRTAVTPVNRVTFCRPIFRQQIASPVEMVA